jgi:hypothetical protein
MKIKKFNENNEYTKNKFYVFEIDVEDRTYLGSIWDEPRKPWVPYGAKLIGEFEVSKNKRYMTISQEQLDEINKIKDDRKREQDAKKYNL